VSVCHVSSETCETAEPIDMSVKLRTCVDLRNRWVGCGWFPLQEEILGVAYFKVWSLCGELCKTDQDVVWDLDYCGPKEPWGS